ncbi:MAG: hypothetical protein R3E39_20360 [Anaerolineae bacterium]
MSDYTNFDGTVHPANGYGEVFYADSWRTNMMLAVDYSWFAADEWQIEQTNRYQSFFHKLGIGKYNTQFNIDGTPAGNQHRSLGLTAMIAASSLAASDSQAWDFIQEFWDTPLTTGQYRYYDGLLDMLALLQLSGNFRVYAPPTAS